MRIIEHAGIYEAPAAPAPTRYTEQLRAPGISVGTYSIARRGHDDQSTHDEDEIYVVTAGAATIWADTGSARVGVGDVIYVPAGETHHFVDVSADLSMLVVFAPPHRTAG
ncbi:cupin domain-containing protein [Luedemannella helvata]|uniref:Cupin domain-containing protein n=1 Tax=Luedemannella helvata TaxID=349315 RepID=A0ABP4WFE5_9ACTN